jgi:excisionase family DNA binding protein
VKRVHQEGGLFMENMTTAPWLLSLHKEFYRPDEVEVASLLRVTRQTVYNWMDRGNLKASKIAGKTLRIRRNDILKLIEERS